MQIITGKEESTNDSKINAVIEFYRAFNEADIQLMQDNWSNFDTASMSNPLGGVKRGWDEVKSVYNNIFNGPAKVYVEYYDFQITSSDQMFVIVGRERGNFEVEDTLIQLKIRTSRVFQLINGQWKQVHHHGSIEDPKLLDNYQKAVLGNH